MEGAGWGRRADREGFSERDGALDPEYLERSRTPLGALLLAVVGLAAGTVGGVVSDPDNSRLNLTVAGGVARAGFALAILAGLWIAFGSRDRAPGARLVGVWIAILAVLLLIVFA